MCESYISITIARTEQLSSQSVGYASATQSLLLATYRALAQLPRSHIPPSLLMPSIDLSDSTRSSPQLQAVPMTLKNQLPSPPSSVGSKPTATHNLPSVMNHITLEPPSASSSSSSSYSLGPSSSPSTSHSSPTSIPSSHLSSYPTLTDKSISTPHPRNPTPRMRLPSLNVPVFQYAWLALAGISCKADEEAFGKVACKVLGLDMERLKVTNGELLMALFSLFFFFYTGADTRLERCKPLGGTSTRPSGHRPRTCTCSGDGDGRADDQSWHEGTRVASGRCCHVPRLGLFVSDFFFFAICSESK